MPISQNRAKTIADNIKKARLRAGLTQPELAQLVGLSKGAIANYENCISLPKVEFLYPLMEALKVDANYIYGVESMESSIGLTPHEREIIEAYRNQPIPVQESIDRILQIDSDVKENAPRAFDAKDA